MSKIYKNLNVYGKELKICSDQPLTGYFRNGCCQNSDKDFGKHLICSRVSDIFLKFLRKNGNDLITPQPHFKFPGLIEGDRWCLCVNRWIEALENDCAPKIFLEATNQIVLKKVDMKILKRFALDLN